ncbi:MAG: hypothetical protein HOV83_14455 [Catenulispora sp.]|nr:hypothetical protein [Catenulispora sp.]
MQRTQQRTHETVRRRIEDAIADVSGPAVLNLHGPLGVGKSRLAREVAKHAGRRLVVLDGADRVDRVGSAEAIAELDAPNLPGTRVLIVGRRPLRSRPGWSGVPLRSFRLGLWPAPEIRRLGRSFGIVDRARLDAVVDLAGGLPLAADVLCRAFADDAAPSDRGALADMVSRAVLARLGTELAEPAADGAEAGPAGPAGLPVDALHVLAALGGADADLLAGAGIPAPDFDRISTLSIVGADPLGRVVAEPFRTVFDLAYRWRHPLTADAVLARAASQRRRQIAATRDPAVRADLSDRVMRTSAHPRVHRAFFPPSAATFRARPATADDERDVIRLFRQWACLEGLERRRADRMLEAWMTAPVPGFHLLSDAEGRAVSLTNLTPISAASGPVLEGLLQQYTDQVAPGGHLLGMLTAATRRPAARAAMLRHILNVAIPSGRVVVSTSWPPYRVLSEDLGLRSLGDTRDDLFGCGRRNSVLERTFTAGSIGPWLRRMEGDDDLLEPVVEAVRSALASLRTPRALGDSPLLEPAGLATPSALADFLRRQIEELTASDEPADAEAGQILLRYYVLRNSGHNALIHEAHLSRATYFRRLDHGVRQIAQAARRLVDPRG